MSLRRPAAITLAAILALAPVLVAAESATAANVAPFVGVSTYAAEWTDNQLGAMTVGQPYSDSITRGPGYTDWEQLGTLPPGLTGSAVGDTFTLSGTPTTPGDYTISFYSRGANFDYMAFYVTVVDSPLAQLSPLTDTQGATLWSPGDSNEVWFEFINNDATVSAYNPHLTVTLPEGVSLVVGDQQGDWVCTTSLPTVDCSSPTAVAPGGSGVAYVATINLDSNYAKSSFVLKNTTSAGNSQAAVLSSSVAVNLPVPVVAPPAAAPYSAVSVLAYAPGGATSGTIGFAFDSASGHEIINASVGANGTATYSGPIYSSFSGTYVTVSAIYYPTAGAPIASTGDPGLTTFYAYQQLNMAGNFYLNGAIYTGAVKLYVYSDIGYSGAFIQYTGLTGGSYNVTPYMPVPHTYYAWAELTGLGNLISFYDEDGTYHPTLDETDYPHLSAANFTNSMHFYWETAPSFTDETIAVPRQNVAYADSVTATNNVTVEYSLASGALPSGLSLNSATGAITGTATTVGEDYSFSITAKNSTNAQSTTTATISGTVLPEHIVPTWVYDTIADFHVGLAVTDTVAADGDPTITYSVSDGELPTGVTFDETTGQLGGAPTVLGETYEFELQAHNTWGDDYTSYTGTVGAALAAPVWTDNTLGEIRIGEILTDGVHASGVPDATYSISAGALPAWADLDAVTGAFTANPTSQIPYDFTIRASNSEGYVEQQFIGSVQSAWVAPSFTDDTILRLQGGVYLDDQVVADGDGTITYSVPLVDLPAWLTLDTTNGLISGTAPLTAVGDAYSFTVTATSVHGTDTVTLSGTVAGPPDLEIEPAFVAGDVAAGAEFDYGVSGSGDSVPFSVTVNSTPVVVASGTTSTLGSASGLAALPMSITAGAHSIVLLSYASDGTPRTTTVWFTVLRNGTIGAVSLLGPVAYTEAALSDSGIDAGPIVFAALLLLGAGYVLRRRRA